MSLLSPLPWQVAPLTVPWLPAAVALDRRCLGGMWSLDSYRQELERPQSILLGLIPPHPPSASPTSSSPDFPSPDFPAPDRASPDRFSPDRPVPDPPPDPPPPDRPFPDLPDPDRPSPDLPDPAPPTPDLPDPDRPTPDRPTPDSSLGGIACLWSVVDEAHVNLLAVTPECQGQGWGQVLLGALLIAAYDRQLEWATLEVRTTNTPAIRLYQKFGFEQIGIRKGYYRKSGADAAILWLKNLQNPRTIARLRALEQQGWDRVHQAALRPVTSP